MIIYTTMKTKPVSMAYSEFKNHAPSPKIEICYGRILIAKNGKVVGKFKFSRD